MFSRLKRVRRTSTSNQRAPLLPALLSALAMLNCPKLVAAATFYVDNIRGSNSNDGRSPDGAWLDPDKLEFVQLSPGDRVLFRSGQVWSGYSIRIDTPHVSVGSFDYSDTNTDIIPALLRSAATLDSEHLRNAGFDIYRNGKNGSAPNFAYWSKNTSDPALLSISQDTHSGTGISLHMKSGNKGQAPRVWRLTPKPLAARLPVSYGFSAKVTRGELYFTVRNTVTGNYLDGTGHWISSPAHARTVAVGSRPLWQRINVHLDNDASMGQHEISFTVSGEALIDDVTLAGHWHPWHRNIYRRSLMTSRALEVYAVYIGDILQARRTHISDLRSDGDWYWSKKERALYFRFSGDLKSLNALPILVNRSMPTLLDLAAPGTSANGLVLEKATEGIRIRSDGSSVRNCIIREMDRYSIQVAEYSPKRDIANVVIDSNEIHDSGNGPYLVSGNFCVITNNHIYNIRHRGTKADNEAIPIMGGHDNLFENNLIHDSWLGIDLWGRPNHRGESFSSEAFNNVVRHNRIYNIDKYGIVIGGVSVAVDSRSSESWTPCNPPLRSDNCVYRSKVFNNYVHHNLIYDSGFNHSEGSAIRHTKAPVTQPNYIFNNTLIKNRISFSGERFSGNFLFINNISAYPAAAHLAFPALDPRRGDLGNAVFEYNLYYPEGDNDSCLPVFVWNNRRFCTFSSYRRYSGKDTKGSMAIFPGKLSADGSNIQVDKGSPIRAGGRSMATLLGRYPIKYRNNNLVDKVLSPVPPNVGAY